MTGKNPHTSAHLQILFAGCVLVLALAAVFLLAFMDRAVTFDEAGLYNPAYMLLHYGRMTYPIHGHFDDMVIHPPVHYLVLAWLMKTGLSLFHAAAVPPILFFLILGWMLLFSPFQFPVKVGLLFGTYLAVLVWTSIQTVRPDVSLSLAWIAGLASLEAGRLAQWDSKRLFAGSLLLTYAATLHYPGSFCWIGALVYVVWSALSLPWLEARRRVAAITAGILLIGVPYVLLFLIPFRHEIYDVIHQVQGPGGAAVAIRQHLEAYRRYSNLRHLFAANQPLVQTLLAPLWHWRVPAAFVGAPLLFAFPCTRGLALAALPQVLFILLGARHKDTRFSGYFAPELILYLSAAISLAMAVMLFLARRLPSRIASTAVVTLGLAGLTALTLHDKSSVADAIRFTRNLNDLDLGRAAARDIAGPHAFVGSTSLGVWYTGGASDFYDVSPEIRYGPSLAIDPKKYFSRFDGLVIDQLNSWVTWNKERVGLTSFYLSRDLHLKGFWFNDRRGEGESQLSWLMFAAASSPVRGYATRNSRMYRFEQAEAGDSVFFCAVCPAADLRNHGQFDSYLTLYFPLAADEDPRTGPDSTLLIRAILVSRQQFQQDVLPNATRCTVRDQLAGRLAEVNSDAMLSQLAANDKTIRFYRSFPTALGGAGRLNPGNTTGVPGIVDLRNIRAVNPQSRVSGRGQTVDVRTAPARWWDAAAIPLSHVTNAGGGFLYVRGKVLDGVVGISVRGHEVNSILGSEAIWGVHDGVSEIYVPIASLESSGQIVVRNQSTRGASDILIEDLAYVEEKPAK